MQFVYNILRLSDDAIFHRMCSIANELLSTDAIIDVAGKFNLPKESIALKDIDANETAKNIRMKNCSVIGFFEYRMTNPYRLNFTIKREPSSDTIDITIPDQTPVFKCAEIQIIVQKRFPPIIQEILTYLILLVQKPQNITNLANKLLINYRKYQKIFYVKMKSTVVDSRI